ncbi:nuclear transport factor 2 family protein [Roseateles amylovorans]|uniref:Nuclear transport factor 2 family protein n=1 Tax=Roseateles amylovorans TaxID=2978473 RepID=A0ABY6AXC7_9BURK|nr:nuclear transport factor 2 family protein [Roseateles amylovorans]UXH76963.1 nuclear transport factor 2 family protein [Roseateles amylovorans]
MTDATPLSAGPVQDQGDRPPTVSEVALAAASAATRRGAVRATALTDADATEASTGATGATGATPPPHPQIVQDQRSVAEVVQAQLEAYNAHDVEGLLACYAPSAAQYEYPDRLLAQGHSALRARMAPRFVELRPQATLLSRIVVGSVVIDHERILNQSPDGASVRELIAIYEVDPAGTTIDTASGSPNENGRIRSARFVFGESRPA